MSKQHLVIPKLLPHLQPLLTFVDAHSTKILLFIISLALGVGFLLMVTSPPALDVGQTDAYWEIAANLINGKGYSLCQPNYFPFCSPTNQITASREPAPVLIFALTALLFQKSLLAVGLLELIAYLGILLVLYMLTKYWADTRTALLAALVWATYFPGLKLISQFSGDLWAALGISIGIYFVLRARNTNRNRDWLFSGLGLGLAVMSRSASLVIVLAIVGGILLERLNIWRELNKWLRPVLIVGTVIASMMLPWMIRNKIALESPIPGSSLTGYNIYRHNYMLGTQDYMRYVGSQEGYQAIQALIARRTDLTGTENESQMDAIYRQEGLKILRAYPAQYALLSAFRFFPLWFNWKVTESHGVPSTHLDYLIMLEQACLLFFALIAAVGRLRETWPLWLSVLFVSVAYMLIDSQLRYLVSVMPLVISMAAAGVVKTFLAESDGRAVEV